MTQSWHARDSPHKFIALDLGINKPSICKTSLLFSIIGPCFAAFVVPFLVRWLKVGHSITAHVSGAVIRKRPTAKVVRLVALWHVQVSIAAQQLVIHIEGLATALEFCVGGCIAKSDNGCEMAIAAALCGVIIALRPTHLMCWKSMRESTEHHLKDIRQMK